MIGYWNNHCQFFLFLIIAKVIPSVGRLVPISVAHFPAENRKLELAMYLFLKISLKTFKTRETCHSNAEISDKCHINCNDDLLILLMFATFQDQLKRRFDFIWSQWKSWGWLFVPSQKRHRFREKQANNNQSGWYVEMIQCSKCRQS